MRIGNSSSKKELKSKFKLQIITIFHSKKTHEHKKIFSNQAYR
jgi:hypothetical protein